MSLATKMITYPIAAAAACYWGRASLICGMASVEGAVSAAKNTITGLTSSILANQEESEKNFSLAKLEAKASLALLLGTVCPFHIGTSMAYNSSTKYDLRDRYITVDCFKTFVTKTTDTVSEVANTAISIVRDTLPNLMSYSHNAINAVCEPIEEQGLVL